MSRLRFGPGAAASSSEEAAPGPLRVHQGSDAAVPAPMGGLPAGLGAVGFGLLAGLAAVLWQSWSTVLTSGAVIVLPWGALLGSLVVFGAAMAWGLRTSLRWVAGLTGLVAFCVVGAASVGGNDQLMVPLDPIYFTATPGAAWSTVVIMLGTVVATLVALTLVARRVPPPAAPKARARR